MFRSLGASRSDRQNRLVAGILAGIGGYVNCAGFVLIGTFTSHVTGLVGRFGNDLASDQLGAALAALTMILAFCGGAFVASMQIESNVFGHAVNAYGAALLSEAALLLLFTVLTRYVEPTHARMTDMQAAILCMAMGMQNSLVTRLSGAVVRTTHMTGVVTDLGIEGARWFRWWRGRLSTAWRIKLSFGRNPPETPSLPKIALLSTIVGAFTAGSIAGAAAAVALRHAAMLVPCIAVAALGAYALWTGARGDDDAHARDTRK